MEFAWFIKANVALIAFYSLYRLLFHKDTFFQLRRFTLLLSFAVALLYPFVDFAVPLLEEPLFQEASTVYAAVLPEIEVWSTQTQTSPTASVLYIIYLVGVSLLTLRFAFQLTSILKLKIRCRKTILQGKSVYILPTKTDPFSFFRSVFLFPSAYGLGFTQFLSHRMRGPVISKTGFIPKWIAWSLPDLPNG